MKLVLYYVFLLVACVLGSQFENVQDQEEPEAKVEEFQFDTEDPEYIKQYFMSSIKSGNVAECNVYAGKYEFLTEKFNRDIFSELIKCFESQDKEETCWELFEILKPSFFNVSRSTTTPLILAARRNRMELVNALLKLEEVKIIIDKVDEFDRTALMYAAKRGSFFAVKMIVQISAESINVKDFLGKTAIHYACEINPSGIKTSPAEFPPFLTGDSDPDAANKASIISILMSYGGLIYPNGPEYKLNPADRILNDVITDFGGKIAVEDKAENIVMRFGAGVAITQLIKILNTGGLFNKIDAKLISFFLANPLMMILNEYCYQLMQYFLPGIDANLNISIDIDDGIREFSFNFLFVFLMIPVYNYLVKNYFKNRNGFKL